MHSFRWMRFLTCVLFALAVQTRGDEPSKEVKNLQLAFVLLSESKLPKAEAIIAAFGKFAPKGQTLRLRMDDAKEQGKKPANKEVVMFDVNTGGTAFVALMPIAVPEGEAERAVRFSVSALGTGWKLPVHNAHLMVTLMDPDKATAVDSMSRFTSILAATAQASGAVGVYWGNAGATHDPKFLISIAGEKGIAQRMMLWTGVSVAREEDGRLSLLSLGMKQFDLPDLLLIAPKSQGKDALETFFDMLAYAAKRGKKIPDGDTVGRTATERLPVRYVPSPVDPKTKVWRIELK